MKSLLSAFTIMFLAGASTVAFSQHGGNPHRVIMQVTQGDSLTQVAVITQLRNVKKQLPGAEIEVVCHGNGLEILMKTGSKVAASVFELSRMNVKFVACENTMARKHVTLDDLLPQAGTVASGLTEIILKQEEGWSYIKGGH